MAIMRYLLGGETSECQRNVQRDWEWQIVPKWESRSPPLDPSMP